MSSFVVDVGLASGRMLAWSAALVLAARVGLARRGPWSAGAAARAAALVLGAVFVGVALHRSPAVGVGALATVVVATLGGQRRSARLRALRGALERALTWLVALVERLAGGDGTGGRSPRATRKARSLRGPGTSVEATPLAIAAGAGLLTAVVRASAARPLTQADAHGVLEREGWLQPLGFLPDRLVHEALGALSGAAPAVATLATGAVLVFFAAVVGADALPRLSRRVSPSLGAAVAACGPAAALLAGHPVRLALVLPALLAWICATSTAAAWCAATPLWLCAPLAALHPFAAAIALAFAAVDLGVRAGHGPAARPALTVVFVARAAAAAAATGVVAFAAAVLLGPAALAETAGFGRLTRLDGFAIAAGIVALAAGLGLALAPTVDRAPRRLAGRRALGWPIAAVAVLALAASLAGWSLPVGAAPALASFAMLAAALAIGETLAAGLAGTAGTAPRRWGVGVTAVAVATALGVYAPGPGGAVPRSALEVASALRDAHLPWSYTTVAPRADAAAYVGTCWFVALEDAPALLRDAVPAASPARDAPARGPLYVVARGPRSGEGGAWLDELVARGGAAPSLRFAARGASTFAVRPAMARRVGHEPVASPALARDQVSVRP